MSSDCRVTPCERCERIARGETCAPDCAGFHIDPDSGAIETCDACGLYDAEQAQTLINDVAYANTPRHFDCDPDNDADETSHCPGWAAFESGSRGLEIERCDTCGPRRGVADDDVATQRAIALLGEWMPGKRIAK